MRRTLRRLAPIAAIWLAAPACESSSGPPPEPTLEFVFDVPRGAFAPEFDVVRTGSAFLVKGTFDRPCGPGYDATATVSRTSNVLTLTLVCAAISGQTCAPAGAALIRYDATIRNAAGVNLLRVIHDTGAAEPRLVFEGNFR